MNNVGWLVGGALTSEPEDVAPRWCYVTSLTGEVARGGCADGRCDWALRRASRNERASERARERERERERGRDKNLADRVPSPGNIFSTSVISNAHGRCFRVIFLPFFSAKKEKEDLDRSRSRSRKKLRALVASH